MQLEVVPWRTIKVGEIYTHYNGSRCDPGPHIVKISEIWNFMEGAFIYTDVGIYWVSDVKTRMTINNTFYKYCEGAHISPDLGDGGLKAVSELLQNSKCCSNKINGKCPSRIPYSVNPNVSCVAFD